MFQLLVIADIILDTSIIWQRGEVSMWLAWVPNVLPITSNELNTPFRLVVDDQDLLLYHDNTGGKMAEAWYTFCNLRTDLQPAQLRNGTIDFYNIHEDTQVRSNKKQTRCIAKHSLIKWKLQTD